MNEHNCAPRRVIIRFRPDISREACRAVITDFGHEIALESWRPHRNLFVALVPTGTEDDWVTAYATHLRVLSASRDIQYQTTE